MPSLKADTYRRTEAAAAAVDDTVGRSENVALEAAPKAPGGGGSAAPGQGIDEGAGDDTGAVGDTGTEGAEEPSGSGDAGLSDATAVENEDLGYIEDDLDERFSEGA